MKMIKKLLVAVLAMAMVLGTMAVSTFAADSKITVEVGEWANDDRIDEVADVMAYCFGAGGEALGGWPGTALTDNGDGTWSTTISADDVVSLIITCNDHTGRTVEIKDFDASKGDVKITVLEIEGEIDDFGTMRPVNSVDVKVVDAPAGDAPAGDAPAEDTPAGDSTAVMGYVVAAVVALAAVVTVVSKKRSVEA